MSFILDALRKSETERQQHGGSEFAVIGGGRPKSAPRWKWIVATLLAINLAVLVSLLFRSNWDTATAPATVPAQIEQPAAVEPEPTSSFAERVAEARRNAPRQQAVAESVPPKQNERTQVTVVSQDPAAIDTSRVYPSLAEVIADGRITLPELHLDIHVFSDVAKDRFVFINMTKHREGSRLEEGPLVSEITPEGVVLNFEGETFLLPRE